MQSLKKKKHEAFVALLQRSSDMLAASGCPGFLPKDLKDEIQSLQMLFAEYELLLTALEVCIKNYEQQYKKLQQRVLSPQLREIRKTADMKSFDYKLLAILLETLRSARA